MARWHGTIGFVMFKEEPADSGIWIEVPVERTYSGNVLRKSMRNTPTEHVNDDINISNEISVVADPFAYQNSQYIKYAEFMGARWKITNIEIQYPRIIMTMGGLYNGG